MTSRAGDKATVGRTLTTEGPGRPVKSSGEPMPEAEDGGLRPTLPRSQVGRVGQQETGSRLRPADREAQRTAKGDPFGSGQDDGRSKCQKGGGITCPSTSDRPTERYSRDTSSGDTENRIRKLMY